LLLVEKFIAKLISLGGTEKVWAEGLNRSLQIARHYDQQPVTPISKSAPKPILPTNLIPRNTRFLDLNPKEIARQMTINDFEEFKKITPLEYTSKLWSAIDKQSHIGTLVKNFNKMTFWVATEIILAKDDKRSLTVQRFIEVMENLKELNNFHGIMIMYSALNLGCVRIFEQLWKELPPKHLASMKTIATLMDPSQNYKNYREALKNAQPPILPFQAVYMTHITFIEEIPNTMENGMVNFEKMHILASVLTEIQRHQETPYQLIKVPLFNEFWERSTILDEKGLYHAAKLPRTTTSAQLVSKKAKN